MRVCLEGAGGNSLAPRTSAFTIVARTIAFLFVHSAVEEKYTQGCESLPFKTFCLLCRAVVNLWSDSRASTMQNRLNALIIEDYLSARLSSPRSMGAPTSLRFLIMTSQCIRSCFFVFGGWHKSESSLLRDSLYVDPAQRERDRLETVF